MNSLTLQNWHLENDRNVLRLSSEFRYKERIFIKSWFFFFRHTIPVSSVLCGLLVGVHVYFPLDVASRDRVSILNVINK